jgi:uncharacterized protein (DUF2141 family)
MKILPAIIVFFIISSSTSVNSAYTQNATLTVKINGIRNLSGNIQIGLYNDADKFPDVGGEYKKFTFKVTATTMQYTISIPSGTYALALFHDENSDGECNTNWLGIPEEGYGFSNNVEPVISAPSFDETKITVSSNSTISINLIY